MALLMTVAIVLVGPWFVGSGLAWLRLRGERGMEDSAPPAGTRALPSRLRARRRALPPAA